MHVGASVVEESHAQSPKEADPSSLECNQPGFIPTHGNNANDWRLLGEVKNIHEPLCLQTIGTQRRFHELQGIAVSAKKA
jgi:hypothetical protein